jgi:hypothetical protein
MPFESEIQKLSPSKRKTKVFMGKLQPVFSRLPAKPPVNYEKGGSDFRTPHEFVSSFGRQIISNKHSQTSAKASFGRNERFGSVESIGPGPGSLGQVSSMRNQNISNRRSAESTSFGTSTRNGALKLYAVYTAKR